VPHHIFQNRAFYRWVGAAHPQVRTQCTVNSHLLNTHRYQLHFDTTDLVSESLRDTPELHTGCLPFSMHRDLSQRICAGRETKQRANATHAAAASCTQAAKSRRRTDRADARDRPQLSTVAMRALEPSRMKSPPSACCCPPTQIVPESRTAEPAMDHPLRHCGGLRPDGAASQRL
jgi:hypothetical protein